MGWTDGPETGERPLEAAVCDLVGVSRATLADPELLVVTHVYPPTRPADAVLQVGQHGFGGHIVPGEDGLTVWIDEDGPVVEAAVEGR